MLETLLESRSHARRSSTGVFVSVTAHTALIAAALYATAQGRVLPPLMSTTVRPVYFPPSLQSPTTTHSELTRSTTPRTPIVFAPQVSVNISAPPLDLSSVMSKPTDFLTNSSGPDVTPRRSGGGEASASPLRADEVEKQAALVPGVRPIYPDALRSAGIEGQVTVEFVVDESGRAEDANVRFLRSDNPLFEQAVRSALRRMRFTPAEIGGRKVRQLVQMPFVFALQR